MKKIFFSLILLLSGINFNLNAAEGTSHGPYRAEEEQTSSVIKIMTSEGNVTEITRQQAKQFQMLQFLIADVEDLEDPIPFSRISKEEFELFLALVDAQIKDDFTFILESANLSLKSLIQYGMDFIHFLNVQPLENGEESFDRADIFEAYVANRLCVIPEGVSVIDHATEIAQTFLSNKGGYSFEFCKEASFSHLMKQISPQEAVMIEENHDVVRASVCSPNGEYVAIISIDGQVKVRSLKTGKALFSINNKRQKIRDVRFSFNNKYLAVASNNQTTKIIDIEKAEVVSCVRSKLPRSVCFSPCDSCVIITTADRVMVNSVETGEEIHSFAHDNLLLNSQPSPDGAYIIVSPNARTINLIDRITGEVVYTFQYPDTVKRVIFSSDSKYLIPLVDDSNSVDVIDIETGQVHCSIQHLNDINKVTFSSDGKYIATASEDNGIRVTEVETGLSVINRVGIHEKAILNICFSFDNKYLITGSIDHNVHIINIENRQIAHTVKHVSSVGQVIPFNGSELGNYIITISARFRGDCSVIQIIDINTGLPVHVMQEIESDEVVRASMSSDNKFFFIVFRSGKSYMIPLYSSCAMNCLNKPKIDLTQLQLLMAHFGIDVDFVKAVRENDVKLTKLLLLIGVSLDSRDQHGLTPLMHATVNGNAQMVEILLQAGAQVNIQEKRGATALSFAISRNKLKIAELLLKAGANINLKDKKGVSLLELAVKQNNIAMVELLLQQGTYVRYKTAKLETSLVVAWMAKNKEMLECLVANGVTPQNSFEKTKVEKVLGYSLDEAQEESAEDVSAVTTEAVTE